MSGYYDSKLYQSTVNNAEFCAYFKRAMENNGASAWAQIGFLDVINSYNNQPSVKQGQKPKVNVSELGNGDNVLDRWEIRTYTDAGPYTFTTVHEPFATAYYGLTYMNQDDGTEMISLKDLEKASAPLNAKG